MRREDCPHAEGRRHDCDYVEYRDSFVAVAEAATDARYPEPAKVTRPEKARWTRKWDAAFHREMVRLVTDPFMVAKRGAA